LFWKTDGSLQSRFRNSRPDGTTIHSKNGGPDGMQTAKAKGNFANAKMKMSATHLLPDLKIRKIKP